MLTNSRLLPSRISVAPFKQSIRTFEYLIDPRKLAEEETRLRNKTQKPKRTTSARPSYRLVDRARIQVSGGSGGKGSLSSYQLRRGSYKIRPDGGNGGRGGDVILVADPNQQTLSFSQSHMSAKDGTNGSSQDCHGRNGDNRIIRVPCGVVVKRVLDYGEMWDEERQEVTREEDEDDAASDHWGGSEDDYDDEEDDRILPSEMYSSPVEPELEEMDDEIQDREKVVLQDLDEAGTYIQVARGGQGGRGSTNYATKHGGLPSVQFMKRRARPQDGERVFLELELKLIADVGLVGFPNAGKSSLLRAMSKASPEVAPYPFTTLHPLLGCIDYQDGFRIQVADIPGLIDGAAEGRGKGHDFLRHVERTKALTYIVDIAGVDYRDPVNDLNILFKEISSYGDGAMVERPSLVLANKVDLLGEEELEEKLYMVNEAVVAAGISCASHVLPVSVGKTGEGLQELSKALRQVVVSAQ